jgi:hypothetical protein
MYETVLDGESTKTVKMTIPLQKRSGKRTERVLADAATEGTRRKEWFCVAASFRATPHCCCSVSPS